MLKKSNVVEISRNVPLVNKEQMLSKIKSKAYEFWELQGRKNGNDRAHWLEAERIVKSQLK